MASTSEQSSKSSKILHLATILLGIAGILSIIPVTITVFAYGMGYSGYIFIFAYLFLITSTFLIIVKTQLGYYLLSNREIQSNSQWEEIDRLFSKN